MALLERACSLHSAGVRAAMLQTVPIEDGVALAGEVDLSNVSVLRAALAAGCARLPEDSASFVVDLASPSFLDVAPLARS